MLINLNVLDTAESSINVLPENINSISCSDGLNFISPTFDAEAEQFYIKGTNRVRKNLHSSRINEEDRRRMISVCEFESLILELQRKQDYQEAMYRIHKQFIQWKREMYFSECDIFFRQLDVANYDMRILVALLMASVQIKQRLSYRATFYNKVIERASCFYSEIEITQIFSSLR